MRVPFVALVFAASAMMPVAALGEDAQATPATTMTAPAVTSSDQISDLDRVVCKQLGPLTGSHLGGKTVCQTKKRWLELEVNSQDVLMKAQRSSNMPAGGGN
jgi:hypothetical protein